jgi:hypothetical protein
MVIMAASLCVGVCLRSNETFTGIEAKYNALIRDKIGEQLRFEPATETTNRKPLRQPAPFGASWEIRFGPNNRFRVLYDVDLEANQVRILAIGEKQRERLLIGGEEVRFFGDHHSTICKHNGTLDSMLFNCTTREAYVSRGPGCSGRWRTFTFEAG